MTIRSITVTVTTSATALNPIAASDGRPYRLMEVTVQNVHASADVYIGDSGVTTSTGFKLTAGRSHTRLLGTGQRLFGIVASSTAECRVLVTELNGV